MNAIVSAVRSGGQTGVDVAALRAAHSIGLTTGGTMPRGWRTLDGPRPEYRKLYGMVEHATRADWGTRTDENVLESDATIRIAVDFQSAGERRTLRAIEYHGKPHFNVHVRAAAGRHWVSRELIDGAVALVRDLARFHGRPIVVNFAGNSEKTAPGIEKAAEGIVRAIG